MDLLSEFFQAWWIDGFLVFVFAYHAIDGFEKGFIRAGLDTAGFALAFLSALLLYRFPAGFVSDAFGFPYFFASALSFFLVWSLADFLWPQATKRLVRRLAPSWKLPKTEKVLGVLPGLGNAALISAILLSVLLAFPVPDRVRAQVSDSPLASLLAGAAASVDNAIRPLLGRYGAEGISLITVSPEATAALELNFTVHDSRLDPASEQELFEAANRERRAAGLRELEWSNQLRDVARLHSDDMFRRGYFGHIDPDGLTPADRTERLGVPYGLVGENLALSPSASLAHRGLMGSPGHRANILKSEFRKLGVGAVDGGVYGKMFTQMFSD